MALGRYEIRMMEERKARGSSREELFFFFFLPPIIFFHSQYNCSFLIFCATPLPG
jgi:hypothetical protein